MNSLKGFYIVCEVTLSLFVPQTQQVVEERFPAKCLVVDDDFMKVGTPDDAKAPVIVDCSSDKTFKMLAPDNIGIFLYYKGEQCEQ